MPPPELGAAAAPQPMRVVFVYFGPFSVNSAIQAFHFGNQLTDMGWEVTLAGEGDPNEILRVGEPRFRCISLRELPDEVPRARRSALPTIAFAWTPRENVRKATLELTRSLGIPYVVHLEDNEEYLLRMLTGLTMEELRRLPDSRLRRIAGDTAIHPGRYPEFMRGAAGVTVITEELNAFNFGARPHHVARPGIDADRFRPDLEPAIARERLGLEPEDFVLVYHGTVHYANQHEMLSLYVAVKLLQRAGRRVRLVRLGETDLGGVDPIAFGALRDGVVELGSVEWREIPRYLALADAFVQPGEADEFNRFRLPSKLPEFLAMGRPVILPNCNIGDDLRDGENALLLERGDGRDVAAKLERLLDDPALAARLATGAREFALAELDWQHNAMALGEFLNRVGGVSPAATAPIEGVARA